MRWRRENDYDDIIEATVRELGGGVTVPLVKAVISVESGFDPRAYREEAHINDASRGLMQMLAGTARGLGFSADPDELFEPPTAIYYGTKFLRDLISTKRGDVLAAVSAYNNGNGKRATKLTTVCLERNSTGDCVRSFTAQPGQFFNQPYVDKVVSSLAYFGGSIPSSAPLGSAGVLLVGAAIGWWLYR